MEVKKRSVEICIRSVRMLSHWSGKMLCPETSVHLEYSANIACFLFSTDSGDKISTKRKLVDLRVLKLYKDKVISYSKSTLGSRFYRDIVPPI